MNRQLYFYCFLITFLLYFCVLQTCALSVLGRTGRDNSVTQTPITIDEKTGFLKKCDPCAKGIRCVPPIQCPAYVRMPIHERPQMCDLPAGGHGYCCTSGYNHTAGNKHSHYGHFFESRSFNDAHDHEDRARMRIIASEAKSEFAGIMHNEKEIVHRIPKGHPGFFHNLVFQSSPQSLMKSIDLSHRAMEQVFASRIYKKREHISTEDFELDQVASAYLDGTSLEGSCSKDPMCPPSPSKYQSQNGECNNLHPQRKAWGAAGTPMERLLPPSYEDGIWEPRTYSVDGTTLRNARTISRELILDNDRPHPSYNLLFMQFGQFITHDVTQSSSITTADGKAINCCTEDGSGKLSPQFLHYGCFPIEVEPYDDFYEHFNQGCINLVRSALSPDSDCKLGYGKQLSKVSHYLDGSAIYGSDLKTQSEVRSFRHGFLRMLDDYGRDLLPLTADKTSCGAEKGPCFFTGDGRSNQIISLTTLHILFGREHNRIAEIIGQINPHWSDEKIFYETRSIVIAKLQYIIYREWLPHVIGSETMKRFGLNVHHHGYSSDYDPEVNSCVTSEFTTAAFRFGHSIVDGKFIMHHGSKIDEIINIPDVMFNSARLRRRHFYDEMLNTLTHQPMQQVDSAVTQGLSKFLFRGDNPFGLDLAAINVQRGRDHGIRCYNDYLEVTGHKRINDFNEFGYDAAHKLSKVYKHPDDIDLWIGGLMESAKGDALLGPTFSEIIADQFSKFRRGDRYFHEHNPEINPGYFSPEQLQEIRASSMARIICDNADGYSIRALSPRAFVRPDVPGNAPVPCNDVNAIPTLNYDVWKE